MRYTVGRTGEGYFTITGVEGAITLNFGQAMSLYAHIKSETEPDSKPKTPTNRDLLGKIIEALQSLKDL